MAVAADEDAACQAMWGVSLKQVNRGLGRSQLAPEPCGLPAVCLMSACRTEMPPPPTRARAVQEALLVQQLREEVELDAGDLAPEWGACAWPAGHPSLSGSAFARAQPAAQHPTAWRMRAAL